jgi:hypothetical protein
MTFLFAVERRHRVLKAKAVGVIASQDLTDLDMASIGFLSREDSADRPVYRALLDFSEVAAIAVPKTRVAARGSQGPVIRGLRVLVQSGAVDCSVVETLVHSRRLVGDNRLVVVDSLVEAYALLGLHSPNFEAIG